MNRQDGTEYMTTYLENPVSHHHARVSPDIARSWVLVPAGKPEAFTAAAESDVDAVILDIEDAVAPPAKDVARAAVVDWLRSGNSAWVRVNDMTTPYWEDDLAALSEAASLAGVMLAKTDGPEHVAETARRLPAGTPILALVESAAGIEAATQIARAESTFRLAFGSGDFRRDTGMADDPVALSYARSRLVVSSRAAGIAGPIDGPTLLANNAMLGRDCRLTVTMGMTGKLCMHPDQAEVVNRELAPSPSDVSWARDVVDALGENGERVADGSDFPRLAKAKKISTQAALFSVTADH